VVFNERNTEMIKTSLIALVAVASVSVAALPAFASEDGVFGIGEQDFGKDRVIAELRQDGVNATSVEEWNGYVRAYVTLDDGRQVMQYFEPGSLAPAAIGGRVATDLAL
jgi:hypothetical protein